MLNLIVIGDSDYEIKAGKLFRSKMKKPCLIKLIKFKEDPCCADLIKQVQILEKKFGWIGSHQGNLNFVLQVS